MQERLTGIRFNVLRNALYHTARRLRFERMSRWMNFAIVLLGTAAFGEAIIGLSIPQAWIGLVVAAIAAAQLAFDFNGFARIHQQLQRDYYNLLADIEATAHPSEENCAHWYSMMVRISGDEPPTMCVVDAKAYNDALASMELDLDEQLVITRCQKAFKHIFSYQGVTFEKVGERKQRLKMIGIVPPVPD